MTQEQKERIEKHFDELHNIATGLSPNIPDDIAEAMKAAYVAGADYALDTYCPRWISVEDELPKLYKEVLVVTTQGRVTIATLRYPAPLNDWWDGDGRYMQNNKPTHWMPLPAPPKEGGEE